MLLYLSMLDTQEEKDKFTEVYEQHQHFCWYVAYQLLGDAHLAEDAVQDAFLALTRHLDKIEDAESPKTRKFLLTIVKSKAVDILRRQHGESSVDELTTEPAAPEEDMLSAYITKENYNHLISCILELDEAYRVIFEYKYVHQLSDREIAQLLDITPKLVNVRYFRARKKLQQMLEKEVTGHAGR
ncbi:MAG TPA: sigma-70 family RNA polymerase sigma factor [Candidatus Merdisoma merdipullorum]|nr:sigma-70 family RNA polymerase sigma factor [Candidatus Merdisoma merdipullorum]